FLLERDVEPLPSPFPAELAGAARAALVEALLGGGTPHPDQARIRRALERFGFYWRRSSGRLAQASTESVAAVLAAQLERVGSWDEFRGARLALDPDAVIPEAERRVLEALAASLHLYGDPVAAGYGGGKGEGGGRL